MEESPQSVHQSRDELKLNRLKGFFGERLSTRRLACVVNKYDLMKYLWKESEIEDHYLERYKTENIDEISKKDDAFFRNLLESGNRHIIGQNQYAKERVCKEFEEKKLKIHYILKEKTGKKWSEIGRCLDIREGKLDSIDREQSEKHLKVENILNIFDLQGHNEFTYVDKICYALVKSRLVELSQEVRKIMED